MAIKTSQPSFWLSVRKEYVIDNFDSLFHYLRYYNYIDYEESTDSDFNRTFDCLKEVTDDYFTETASDGLCKNVKDTWEEKFPFIIKVISTYIVAAKSKKNIDDWKALSKLIDILILAEQVKSKEIIAKLRSIIENCILEKNIKRLGITWDNIAHLNKNSLEWFCHLLSQTCFEESTHNTQYIYENKGTLIVEKDGIHITSMNYTNYLKKRFSMHPLFTSIISDISITIPGRDKILSYEQLLPSYSNFTATQCQTIPSPATIKKTYEDNSEIIVRVTNIDSDLYVESIDPTYESIKGKVWLKAYYKSISREEFMEFINIGDFIRVTKQSNSLYPFKLDDTFEDYYDRFAEEAEGYKYWAIFTTRYKGGVRWLTEEGIYVNIMDSPHEPTEAIEQGYPIRIRILNAITDKAGNLVLNGTYYDDEGNTAEEYEAEDFGVSARKFLFDGFIKDCFPEALPTASVETRDIDDKYVSALSHAIYFQSLYETETLEKSKALYIAGALATMAEHTCDCAYIKHEMDYINCCVKFASGDTPSDLQLSHDPCLDGIASIQEKEKRIDALRSYDNRIIETSITVPSSTNALYDNIQGLINASNMLVDKISPFEINRIKKAIASRLGVADMYCSICNTLTYYGEESDTLEFKSSVVFPPNSGMTPDPTRQKWHILKAICGFLNTAVGGELIIGVNDYGNSCGLNDDIDHLYKARLIGEKSIDKLRNYIKQFVDKAFVDDTDTASFSEITATRIKYVIEKNAEEDHIIRIQINPYEYGIVEFYNKEELPEGIAPSYYRTSGATTPMTSELKRQARESKNAVTQDENAIKLLTIQKAKNERSVVILKNYSSKSGVRSRRVETFQLLPKRNAFIGYDIDKRAIREFKTTRFTEVLITNEKWKNTNKHKNLSIDTFDMLESPNTAPIEVILKLKRTAYNLLIEEYSNATEEIKDNTDTDATEYPYILHTKVNDIKGIGRFYIGLAKEIKIVAGEQLTAYAKEYIKSISGE